MKNKNKKRPAVILTRILQLLSEAAMDATALSAAVIVSGYGASRRRIETRKEEILESCRESSKQSYIDKRRRQSFKSILSKLKRDGLIREKDEGFTITQLGIDKLRQLCNYLPAQKYKKESSNSVTIFMFDIPEKERYMRDWLRRKILEMDFKLVQKSVFVGKGKIPEEFINDLRRFNIVHYIDIFSVTKRGSLRQII